MIIMQTPDTSSLPQVQDAPSKALNILSFICPPLGLIIYLSLIGKMPRQALSAGLSATKGVVAYIALFLFWILIMFGMFLADDVFHLFDTPESSEVTVTTKPPIITPPLP